MNIDIMTFLIACPFVALAGFVDSIAGGGGLISLPGYMIAGLPPVTASATNKLSAFMGGSVSFYTYIKNGFVNFKLAIPAMIVAASFSSIGAKVQMLIPEIYLKIFMLIALPITLLFTLNKKNIGTNDDKKLIFNLRTLILTLLISAAMGFYDGLYGPATGTFLLIFFVKVISINIKDANGLAKSINWATNVGALVLFLFSGRANIVLGLTAGIFNMIGAYLGSKLFIKKGVNVTAPIMTIVMIIFIIKLITELFI